MAYYKEEAYDQLKVVDKRLRKEGLYLDLKIVGGTALLLNGIHSIETTDIDTINKVDYEVKEILDDYAVDVNDDALDYVKNFDDLEFIRDEEVEFTNITIEYLNLAGVIKTKMKDTNPDKLQNLYYVLEEDLNVDMSVNGIADWFRENGEEPDMQDIETFIEETQYGCNNDVSSIASIMGGK